jgi:hypothetical protein
MCAAVAISGLEPIERGHMVRIFQERSIRLRLAFENTNDAYSGSATIF